MKGNLLYVLQPILLIDPKGAMFKSIKINLCMTINSVDDNNACTRNGITCVNCPCAYSVKESTLIVVVRGY